MASTASAVGICYLSYWNERKTCCIKLQTLNVIRSLYFWQILYFFPSSPSSLILALIEMDKTAGKITPSSLLKSDTH